MASQITSLTSVYSTVYSGADQRKHQISASLVFVGNSQVTGEFPAQRACNVENVSIWWRHHVISLHKHERICFLWFIQMKILMFSVRCGVACRNIMTRSKGLWSNTLISSKTLVHDMGLEWENSFQWKTKFIINIQRKNHTSPCTQMTNYFLFNVTLH